MDRILRKTVNKGAFNYYKYQRVVPVHPRSSDPYRQHRKSSRELRPMEEWIIISAPPIVSEAMWAPAQEQLRQNSRHSPRNNKRHQYLLRGLIRCPRCGSTYTGAAKGKYRVYRCSRTDPSLSSTGQRCSPASFQADPVEQVVWQAIKETLHQPEVLVAEYQRRLALARTPEAIDAERKQLALALKRLKAREDRVTDAYVNEAIGLDRYKLEMARLGQRRKDLELAAREIDRRERQEQDSRRALEHLEAFCRRVARGLEAMTFEERPQLLRLVVERITVDNDRVRIETIIPTGGEGGQLRIHPPERSEASQGNVWAPDASSFPGRT